MLSHPLTNFKIQKYYQNEPWFNGAHSRNKYAINFDDFNQKEVIGNLCVLMVILQHTLVALKLNIFQQRLWATKILQQILTEYMHTI